MCWLKVHEWSEKNPRKFIHGYNVSDTGVGTGIDTDTRYPYQGWVLVKYCNTAKLLVHVYNTYVRIWLMHNVLVYLNLNSE